LDHFNGLHIRNKSVEELATLIKPYFLQNGYEVDDEKLKKIVPIIQERLVTLDDCLPFAAFFFKDEVIPEAESLIAKKLTAAESLKIAEDVLNILKSLPDISHETAEQPMRDYIEESGYKAGQVFGLLRTAVTAQEVSPPLFESMEIIGKHTVIRRMEKAVELLKGLVEA
jgi:glutamyl-tRNA synthetase